MKDTKLLTTSINSLKGIGKQRAILFNKIKIFNINDLIHHYPREYEDRSQIVAISELDDDNAYIFKARVLSRMQEKKTKSKLIIYSIKVGDSSGTINLQWYNQSYLKHYFKLNKEYFFFGKLSNSMGITFINSPIFEDPNSEKINDFLKIAPVYSTTKDLGQNIIRTTIQKGLELIKNINFDKIPQAIVKKYNLINTYTALKYIHSPDDFELMNLGRRTLVFEELLMLQLSLLSIKEGVSNKKSGISFSPVKEDMAQFINNLSFKLTDSQVKTYKEIEGDMESNYSMNRLLQGDVGSGKTIIAILALFKAVKNGFQGTLMVPTEILARQHYESFKALLSHHGIKIDLLLGSQTKKTKNVIKDRLLCGNIDILIGTHTLIQNDVEFDRLGLVITDEQHRFGVRQRSILSKKGSCPDVLVMSATPIPRTLGLILYGDLDISVINQLPPGRIPINTHVIDESKRERINLFIEKNVNEGSQVYIVCPLIEESESLDLSSAQETFNKLVSLKLKNVRIKLLHGKMKALEKTEIVEGFIQKKFDVLVSTTVIEVGINIPNANIMIIENAERFGLLQLHQIRGRVGRGHKKSYCILYNQSDKKHSKNRLLALEESNDGFVISEKDLKLRGPGDFFGTKQHGLPQLKIANLYEDISILNQVQEAASYIFSNQDLLNNFEIPKLNDIDL